MTASNNVQRTTKGVSLLISIVLIAIITVFAMGISNAVISAIRNTGNINNANMAYYAAEGALEQGLLQSALQGAGYNAIPTVTYCTAGTPCPTATVKIQGTVPSNAKIDGAFIIPTPGTGTAGTNCNPLTAVTSDTFPYSYTNFDVVSNPVTTTSDAPASDHPCNWNKINVGETIAIPLYTITTYGSSPNIYTTINNPVQLGLTSLKIKIRTPCKNGLEMCPAIDRYVLNAENNPDAPYGGNDPIVSWQITGTDPTGTQTYTLAPNLGLDYVPNTLTWRPSATAIYESLINSKKLDGNFVVLKEADSPPKFAWDLDNSNNGQYGKGAILNFLLNKTILPMEVNKWSTHTITKPMLKLTVVHSLEESITKANIPYLEYQITTNISSTALLPSDNTQTITAEGLSGTFKWVLEVKQPQESGLLEYVIQQ